MITRVKVSNFKCIKQIDITLSPLTAFVGPNDSGKSTLLKAIYTGATGNLDFSPTLLEAFPDFTLGPDGADDRFPGVDNRFQAVFGPSSYEGPTVTVWHQSSQGNHDKTDAIIERTIGRSPDPTDHEYSVGGSREKIPALVYNPRPDTLKHPSYLAPTQQGVRLEDPYALPSILAELLGENREVFLNIEQCLREWVPTIHSIILKRCPINGQSGDCLWFRLASGELVPSIMMSDGTMLLLGYITIFHAPPRPNLILIDGPEEGIHPRALKKLVAFFREAQARDRELQILMSSHSADLLSLLEPQEIVLTYREEGAYTQAVCLDQHPNLDAWLDGLTPGELWLWDGEQEIINRIQSATERVDA